MICPRCGDEYRTGFDRCADCGIALVDDLDAGPANRDGDERELVTVLADSDAATLALARSILEGAGIRATTLGEGLQDLFGAGRLGGWSLAGPARLVVASDDAESARSLLAELMLGRASGSTPPDPNEDDIWRMPPIVGPQPAVDHGDEVLSPGPSETARFWFRALVAFELVAWGLQQKLFEWGGWDLDPALWLAIDESLPGRWLPPAIWNLVDLLWILAAVGLWLFWGRARYLYVGAWLFNVVFIFTEPAAVVYGLERSFQLLGRLAGGAVLALSFYGPLSKAFERAEDPRRNKS